MSALAFLCVSIVFAAVATGVFVPLSVALWLSLGWALGEVALLSQVAATQIVVLVVGFWVVSFVWYGGDCWPFDSLGWPLLPLYTVSQVLLLTLMASPQALQLMSLRHALVVLVAVLYAVRLNACYFRSMSGGDVRRWLSFVGEEDWRYQGMRAQLAARGVSWFLASLVLVFLVQWVMLFVAVVPLALLVTDYSPVDHWDVLCALIIVSGILLEYVADTQLAHYMESPSRSRPAILREGLWRYSRHPNYFGQTLVWIGVSIWSAARGHHWMTFLAPLNIVALLVLYSVDAMEERMLANPKRRADYQHYQRTTSRLILFPSVLP